MGRRERGRRERETKKKGERERVERQGEDDQLLILKHLNTLSTLLRVKLLTLGKRYMCSLY